MIENALLTLSKKLDTPGEHLFFLPGNVGKLEVALLVPESPDKRYIALLGHPHSLQGGTMNNKVVTTVSRAFKELNIASLRFNFRGVGQSEGTYAEGLGESEDMLQLARLCLQDMPDIKFIFAGFSFGSYVAYRAAAQVENELLITVAPSVERHNYMEFSDAPAPWVVLHGDDDEVVPLQPVLDFVTQASTPLPLLRFAETGHFFHGKLIALKERLMEVIRTELRLL